jgi:hypothetical protein
MYEPKPPLQELQVETRAMSDVETPERLATIWVSRLTGAISAIFVLIALALWASRHGHYRLVLAFLVVAMFAAILHTYTFENGGS